MLLPHGVWRRRTPPLRSDEGHCASSLWCMTLVNFPRTQLWMVSLLQASYNLDSFLPNFTLNGASPKYTFNSVNPKYTFEAVGVNYTFEAVGPLHECLCVDWCYHACLYCYYFWLSALPTWRSRLRLPIASPCLLPLCRSQLLHTLRASSFQCYQGCSCLQSMCHMCLCCPELRFYPAFGWRLGNLESLYFPGLLC